MCAFVIAQHLAVDQQEGVLGAVEPRVVLLDEPVVERGDVGSEPPAFVLITCVRVGEPVHREVEHVVLG